jgi:hypothetical protein
MCLHRARHHLAHYCPAGFTLKAKATELGYAAKQAAIEAHEANEAARRSESTTSQADTDAFIRTWSTPEEQRQLRQRLG